jgi:hypothetical protein
VASRKFHAKLGRIDVERFGVGIERLFLSHAVRQH